jgi:hypothetical protein
MRSIPFLRWTSPKLINSPRRRSLKRSCSLFAVHRNQFLHRFALDDASLSVLEFPEVFELPAGPVSLNLAELKFTGVGNSTTAMSTAPGRNAPCPCGSNKKYKHCCLPKRSRHTRARWTWVICASGAALAVAGGSFALNKRHASDASPEVAAAPNTTAAPQPGAAGTNAFAAPSADPSRIVPAEGLMSKTEGELRTGWLLLVRRKDWQRALETARAITALAEDKSSGWLMQAYCLHGLNCTEEAFELLGGVVEKFPNEELPAYNLACYACQVGKLDDARRWLKKAMQVGRAVSVKAKALKDNDLKSLWPEIEQM